jgi:hypothetical protein
MDIRELEGPLSVQTYAVRQGRKTRKVILLGDIHDRKLGCVPCDKADGCWSIVDYLDHKFASKSRVDFFYETEFRSRTELHAYNLGQPVDHQYGDTYLHNVADAFGSCFSSWRSLSDKAGSHRQVTDKQLAAFIADAFKLTKVSKGDIQQLRALLPQIQPTCSKKYPRTRFHYTDIRFANGVYDTLTRRFLAGKAAFKNIAHHTQFVDCVIYSPQLITDLRAIGVRMSRDDTLLESTGTVSKVRQQVLKLPLGVQRCMFAFYEHMKRVNSRKDMPLVKHEVYSYGRNQQRIISALALDMYLLSRLLYYLLYVPNSNDRSDEVIVYAGEAHIRHYNEFFAFYNQSQTPSIARTFRAIFTKSRPDSIDQIQCNIVDSRYL